MGVINVDTARFILERERVGEREKERVYIYLETKECADQGLEFRQLANLHPHSTHTYIYTSISFISSHIAP